jgi:hypothetical protein
VCIKDVEKLEVVTTGEGEPRKQCYEEERTEKWTSLVENKLNRDESIARCTPQRASPCIDGIRRFWNFRTHNSLILLQDSSTVVLQVARTIWDFPREIEGGAQLEGPRQGPGAQAQVHPPLKKVDIVESYFVVYPKGLAFYHFFELIVVV